MKVAIALSILMSVLTLALLCLLMLNLNRQGGQAEFSLFCSGGRTLAGCRALLGAPKLEVGLPSRKGSSICYWSSTAQRQGIASDIVVISTDGIIQEVLLIDTEADRSRFKDRYKAYLDP